MTLITQNNEVYLRNKLTELVRKVGYENKQRRMQMLSL